MPTQFQLDKNKQLDEIKKAQSQIIAAEVLLNFYYEPEDQSSKANQILIMLEIYNALENVLTDGPVNLIQEYSIEPSIFHKMKEVQAGEQPSDNEPRPIIGSVDKQYSP